MLRSRASRLRALSDLRSDFFDARWRRGLPSSFVRRRRRLCLRDAVDDECVSDLSEVLMLTLSECAPPVLRLELVVFDDELGSGGPLLGAVGVHGIGSPVTDSLRRALMVAD